MIGWQLLIISGVLGALYDVYLLFSDKEWFMGAAVSIVLIVLGILLKDDKEE